MMPSARVASIRLHTLGHTLLERVADREMMDSIQTKARIAVNGTGWWTSEMQIPALLRNRDAKLVALCDRDPAGLERTSRLFGI